MKFTLTKSLLTVALVQCLVHCAYAAGGGGADVLGSLYGGKPQLSDSEQVAATLRDICTKQERSKKSSPPPVKSDSPYPVGDDREGNIKVTGAGILAANGLYHFRRVQETPNPWEYLYGKDWECLPWFKNYNGSCILWNTKDHFNVHQQWEGCWICVNQHGMICYKTKNNNRGDFPPGIYGPPVGSPDSTGWTAVSPCPDCTLEDGSKIDQWMFCKRCDASGTIPNGADPAPTFDLMPDLM